MPEPCIYCRVPTERVQRLSHTGAPQSVCSRFCGAELHRTAHVGAEGENILDSLYQRLQNLREEKQQVSARVDSLAHLVQYNQYSYQNASVAHTQAEAELTQAQARIAQAAANEQNARRSAYLVTNGLAQARKELDDLNTQISQMERRIAALEDRMLYQPEDTGRKRTKQYSSPADSFMLP